MFTPFTLQDLGNLGEFVGALGVVISLIYLAKQMQQNTTSVRAEMDPSALSPEEKVRWDAYMTAVYRHFGNLVYQYRMGALDREMWESYERTLAEHLRTPSWRGWFLENRSLFSKYLVEQVEMMPD